jgi:F-type H+-transporting ATPase subunit a
MPHGESWLTVLLRKAGVLDDVHGLVTGNLGEHTWLGHAEVKIEHVLGWLLVFLIVSALGIAVGNKVRDVKAALVPDSKLTVRSFFELFVETVYGQMKAQMGAEAAKFFLPLIGTCAFLIFFSNFLGLIPGFNPPTATLNTTLACSIVIFLTTHVWGVRHHGLAYFKHFFGPIWWLAPLMFPIELISHLVRPASLAIRLMANMTADHLVVATFLALGAGLWALVLPDSVDGQFGLLLPVPMLLLGFVVVLVQTAVFCLLSTVYIGMAIEHSEEH